MKASKRRFFSGNTLERAVVTAAVEFGIDPSEVAYRQIEKKHGFLNLRRRFVIEVDPASPKLDTPREEAWTPPDSPSANFPEAPSVLSPGEPAGTGSVAGGKAGSHPRQDSRRDSGSPRGPGSRSDERGPRGPGSRGRRRGQPPRSPVPLERGEGPPPRRPRKREDRDLPLAEGEIGEVAREALGRTLALLGLDIAGEVYQGENRLEVELGGPEGRFLTDQHGKALFAVEHLFPKLVRGLSGEKVFCSVDCRHFREDREEELREIAARLADEVRRSGRPRSLDHLNPAERRIVHMELAEEPDVETESEGQGYLKRLVILPG